jgi:hypothetical protein
MNEQPHDDGNFSPGLLRRQRERLHARREEHRREAADKSLALRVHNSLIRCGLSRSSYSIASGDMFHSPQVTSADTGPPGWVEIDMLPGQSPDDFARHAEAIAHDLNVSKVRVVPLKTPRIRLELSS